MASLPSKPRQGAKMRPGHANSRRKAVLAATSLIGLLLAVAGLTSATPGGENQQARIALDLPPWLGVTFLLLMWLAALGIFILLLPGIRQRSRRRESQSWRTIAPLLSLLVLILVWGELRDHQGIGIFQTLRTFLETSVAPPMPTPEIDLPPPVQSPLLSGIVQALVLALALFVFAVIAWIYLGLRPRHGRGLAGPVERAVLGVAVQDSLDDLRDLPDARLAILRCYDRFERLLAGAALGRPPWQTALEFMRTALAYSWLPREGVRELTSLFEAARFSQHALGPGERERAWQALMAIKTALEKESLHASPT
jgi:hypothetical protein